VKQEKQKAMKTSEILFSKPVIVTWDQAYKADFERLNREWIESIFSIEPSDLVLFNDPQKEVINKGGQIFFAIKNDKAVGCVALIRHQKDVYEISKLSVSRKERGFGLGKLLIDSVIQYARHTNIKELVIESNSILTNAIHLYKKYGFQEVKDFVPSYKRVNAKYIKSIN